MVDKIGPVLEVVRIQVDPAQMTAFEGAIAQAYSCLEATEGHLGHQLYACIEKQGSYLLQIQWTSLDAHLVNFRQSDNYQQWRSLIGSFFVEPPEVLHYHQQS
jgi:quinol monooxygenase YgiN